MTSAAMRIDGVARFAVGCGPVFLILCMIFFVLVAGFLPLIPPSKGGADVAAFFAEHRKRITTVRSAP
jgi:hypothetical protein